MTRSERHEWQHVGARSATIARRPAEFVRQHTSPLFFVETEPPPAESHEIFHTEEKFWERSSSISFSSVCLSGFQLTDWFPRAPGVYWSRHGMRAREYSSNYDTVLDPELGQIFNPQSKMELVENGGLGTIRLCPRRIDDTDCWLATAVAGKQCAGGIPLAIPDFFIRNSKIEWGDTTTIYGRVRFLKEAGLDDTAAYVHHASPVIVFVDKIEGTSRRKQSSMRLTLTPVALFDQETTQIPRRGMGKRDRYGYTFVQCAAGIANEIDDAAGWIEQYARKHGGKVVTNFDERIPILADAPLSYQRLLNKTYDRLIIENVCLNGGKLADRIDQVGNQYSNYGQTGAMGEYAHSDGNQFMQSAPSAKPTASGTTEGLVKRSLKTARAMAAHSLRKNPDR